MKKMDISKAGVNKLYNVIKGRNYPDLIEVSSNT